MSVQAAICRVMKVRKESGHRDLVAQVRGLVGYIYIYIYLFFGAQQTLSQNKKLSLSLPVPFCY